MRFGFNLLLWTVHVEPRHHGVFGRLAELGYDGVEVPVGVATPAECAALRLELESQGLAATACSLATPETDPTSADPSIRRAALAHLLERIDCAHELGSGLLVGPLYAAHRTFCEPAPGAEARRRAASILAAACEHAEAAGVTLCLEPLNRFEVQLVNTVDEALQLVELVGHPRLAVHYDTHHAHIEETDHAAAIQRCGGRLGHLQLSESHRGTLGTGQVRWDDVARGLRAVGYDGWVVAEAFGTGVEHLSAAACVHRDCFESRDEVMSRALPFMRELLEEDR